MKIEIDEKKCIGCGLCSELDTENFGTEGNKAIAKKADIKKTKKVNEAIISCPAGAITLR